MPNNFDALKKLYTEVFLAHTDYIPLIVNVRCPGQTSREELARDTANAVRHAAAGAALYRQQERTRLTRRDSFTLSGRGGWEGKDEG